MQAGVHVCIVQVREQVCRRAGSPDGPAVFRAKQLFVQACPRNQGW